MDCEAYHILITGYLDQELSDDEMQMLKAHLSTCKSCFAYLNRMETMETVLKRYKLLQESPEVPPDFAQNIAVILQGVVQKEKISLSAKVRIKYQEFVLRIVERWVSSLRTRPFAWITSMSVLVVVLIGGVFVNVVRTVYEEPSGQQVNIRPQPVLQVAQKDKASVEKKSLQLPAPAPKLEKQSEPSLQAPVESEPIQYVETTSEPVTRTAKPTHLAGEEEKRPSLVIEASRGRAMDETELAEVAKESFMQVAKSDRESVEGYVYSHVIEISQEQFIDDAVFVGYVQNISLK